VSCAHRASHLLGRALFTMLNTVGRQGLIREGGGILVNLMFAGPCGRGFCTAPRFRPCSKAWWRRWCCTCGLTTLAGVCACTICGQDRPPHKTRIQQKNGSEIVGAGGRHAIGPTNPLKRIGCDAPPTVWLRIRDFHRGTNRRRQP
jgi:hypothetical protein